ncbi:MAG: diaminopimelate epimerase [Thermovirgaceae bacterium]
MPAFEFTKMQGNGNDFIVIDNRECPFSKRELSRLAVVLCPRGRSVGADGLIAVEVSGEADFTIRLFNSDGTEAEMCGNGARCIARYTSKKCIAPSEMTFSTLAGPVRASVTRESVTLDMGTVDLPSVRRKEIFSFSDEKIQYTHLTLGVPHTVVFPKCIEGKDRPGLRRLAETIQADTEKFPEGTNVNFITGTAESLHVQTFERGVEDFTLSCGTGSAASAVAAWLEGLVKPPVSVKNPGGVNIVSFPNDRGLQTLPVTLTGPAEFVYEGHMEDPALLELHFGRSVARPDGNTEGLSL